MKCPFCSDMENKVVDSRLTKEGLEIRRRRECQSCEKRFTTYERIEEILPMVVKKDGRREPFDRVKILSGVKNRLAAVEIPIKSISCAQTLILLWGYFRPKQTATE